MYQYAEQLLDLIEQSPSRYHTTANLKNRLTAEGYTALAEDAAWDVRPGGRSHGHVGHAALGARVMERVGVVVHKG